MIDIVGDRLKKQVMARRKDNLQYIALYAFLAANGVFILHQLFHKYL